MSVTMLPSVLRCGARAVDSGQKFDTENFR
jgi:hypothetical protein